MARDLQGYEIPPIEVYEQLMNENLDSGDELDVRRPDPWIFLAPIVAAR